MAKLGNPSTECLKKKTNFLDILTMQIRNLTKDIEIDHVFKDRWSYPLHKHTHYEIQYIIKGKGQHFINQELYDYGPGDIFITLPQDDHLFLFQEKTAVCIIKFNEVFFQSNFQKEDLELLKHGLSISNRKIFLKADCRKNIGDLIRLLIKTHKTESTYQQIISRSTLSLILTLIIDESNLKLSKPRDEKIQSIIRYIQDHIGENEHLAIQNISHYFNINKTYFSHYFKKATGHTYKKYVQEYTLNIIAHQLAHQDKTLSQLAYEYGYSDQGHLSRSFKQYFKMSPIAFKSKLKKQG